MKTNRRSTLFTSDAKFSFTLAGKPTVTDPAQFAAINFDDGKVTLAGYAMVWGTLSSDRGGFKVRLLPGSAQFETPTLALVNHEYRDVIGNTGNGTLRVTSDAYGAKVEIDLPDTTTGRDTAVLVRDRYIRGMSFGMAEVIDSAFVTEDGQEILNVAKFTADEVTVTAIPAFIETDIALVPPAKPDDYTARSAAQANRIERYRFDILTL